MRVLSLIVVLAGCVVACKLAIAESHTNGQQAELLGLVRVPGTATDLSRLDGTLETNTPANAFGGLSAIEYTGKDNVYFVLSDRGPADGAASFPCRFHRVSIDVAPANSPKSRELRFQLLSTHLFKDKFGHALTGSLAAMKAWDGRGNCPSLDPEGIRRLGGNIAISDEYGPSIQLFRESGEFVSSIPLPSKFGLAELRKPAMVEGAFSNRGIEGLCVSSDQSTMIGALQGPLVQDGRIENNKCLGIHTRWILLHGESSSTMEYVYDLEDETTGVSEILAVDHKRYLVLERDSLSGSEAKIKRIYLCSTSGATDVSHVASLAHGIPAGMKSVSKELLVDLMLPAYGLDGLETPEKPEGLAWGPSLSDGRRLLMVCFDNDFDSARDTILAAFALPKDL